MSAASERKLLGSEGTEGSASGERVRAGDDEPLDRPGSTAAVLERWALSREKILHLIDLKQAKRARELAKSCHSLAAQEEDLSGPSFRAQWLRLRREVETFLGRGRA